MDSKLQIISGVYRGRKLNLPRGARPTQNLARGAIFNMLTGICYNRQKITVWDAFAGSGALGIETLSRFPNATVIFTDVLDESVKTIRNNTEKIAANRFSIIMSDASQVIKKYGNLSDLVFVDPPYANPELGINFVKKLATVARAGTIVVQEIEVSVPYSPDKTTWEILRDKTYGRARFVILRRNDKK